MGLFKVAAYIFAKEWDRQAANAASAAKDLKTEIARLEKQAEAAYGSDHGGRQRPRHRRL